jgi:hypothetical protein
VTLQTGSALVKIGEDAPGYAGRSFAGCTSLKTFGVEGATFKDNVVVITGAAQTAIQAGSFDGCTSISAVEFIGDAANSLRGNVFSNCTGLKDLTISGTIGAVSINAANGQIPRVENFIWNSAGDLGAAVDISGLTGLKKLVVTVEQDTAVAAVFPTHEGFATLEIKDDDQDGNVNLLFDGLPATVKNVIIGTGPVTTNPATTLAPLAIGNDTPASLFKNVVDNITFTGAIGTLGTSFFGALTGPVTVSINGGPTGGFPIGFAAGYTGFRDIDIIETVNVGPKTPAFDVYVISGMGLKAINVDKDNAVMSNGNPNDGVLYSKKDGVLVDLIQYPIEKADVKYVIPEGVGKIKEWAFSVGAFPKELTIPKSITAIEAMAMRLSDLKTLNYNAESASNVDAFPVTLTKVTFGEGVRVIPTPFFTAATTGITEITIPESVTLINGTFTAGLTMLEKVNYYASDMSVNSKNVFLNLGTVTEVNIGNKVKRIPEGTFSGTGIGKIDLNKVVSIGTSAFQSCNGLSKVIIPVECVDIGELAFSTPVLTYVDIYSKTLSVADVNAFKEKGAGAAADLGDLYDLYIANGGGSGSYTYFDRGGTNQGWKKVNDL